MTETTLIDIGSPPEVTRLFFSSQLSGMELPPEAPPLGKYLASSDKKTRDKAFKHLSGFLSNNSQEPLPKSELTKLWKGLFYCYWMSDKPLVQQALSSEFAELTLSISTTSASLSFLKAFWEATVREWNGIDRLRLDKYYMLIRKFTNAAFRLLIRVDWQEDACAEYNAILSTHGGPLCPEDIRVPSSLAYHLADIYLEELDKISDLSTTSAVPLCTILSPFLNLAAHTHSNITFKRIQTSLFDPLFSNISSAAALTKSPYDGSDPKRKRARMTHPTFQRLVHNSRGDGGQIRAVEPSELLRLLYQRIFDVASKEETRDVNRRKLYAIWRDGIEEIGSIDVDAS